MLEEKFGYKQADSEKIVELLGNMTVPQGRERYFAQTIQPVIERALKGQKTEKGFRRAVMRNLGTRNDTAFNLRSPVGKSSYMQTESFKNSGLNEAGLQNYMQSVHPASGMSQNRPVYARASATEPLQTVSLGQAKKASPAPLALQALEMGASASKNTSMSSAMPQSSVSIPRNYDTSSVQAKSATAPVNAELARLRRMEENYEKDKAMLRKETSPALARSASHDIGHAEDDGVAMVADEDEVKKMKRKFGTFIASQLSNDTQV